MCKEGLWTAKTQCKLLLLSQERPPNSDLKTIYSMSFDFKMGSHYVSQAGLKHVNFSNLGFQPPESQGLWVHSRHSTVTGTVISSPSLQNSSISQRPRKWCARGRHRWEQQEVAGDSDVNPSECIFCIRCRASDLGKETSLWYGCYTLWLCGACVHSSANLQMRMMSRTWHICT